MTPAKQHARIAYALHEARFDLYKRRGEFTRPAYQALVTALGKPGVSWHTATGFVRTLERHLPAVDGTCTGCRKGTPWPCNEILTVKAVLAELGWAT